MYVCDAIVGGYKETVCRTVAGKCEKGKVIKICIKILRKGMDESRINIEPVVNVKEVGEVSEFLVS